MKNSKYKYIMIFMIILCSIFIMEDLNILKNIKLKQKEFLKIENEISNLVIKNDISYGYIINKLRDIKGIKILNFTSKDIENIWTVDIEVYDTDGKIKDVFRKIKQINGFSSINNIKINNYNDKNLKVYVSINFSP